MNTSYAFVFLEIYPVFALFLPISYGEVIQNANLIPDTYRKIFRNGRLFDAFFSDKMI